MDKYYIILILCLPLVVALISMIMGTEEIKENEVTRGVMSRIVYYSQFVLSIITICFFENPSDVSYKFIHLNDYHFNLLFSIKQYSLALAIVISLTFIVVERLSFNYLHAEEEHTKFYGLKLLLNFAVMAFIFSTNIDFLFFTWEVVGISSALLISYFYRRNQAIEHSLFAFSIYRVCDAAFLLTALFLYYFYHTDNIEAVASGTPALILGLLIFLSIMGKSGVWPFSSWLPLALEGPTPSSNLYYMTLSTHMGIIFLIKIQTLWEYSLPAKAVMLIVLILNVLLASMSARVQSSIKSSLAYAALAQVSLILIEVILGFYTFALIHMTLHIFYRLAQMTNSPSIIDQHNFIERMLANDITPRKIGHFYYDALNGFGSEKIVNKFFGILLIPFIFIDKVENKILNNYVETDKNIASSLLKKEVAGE